MRRTSITLATAAFVIVAASVPMTAYANEASPVNGVVATEDDPIDPVAPAPPATEPEVPGPTAPEGGEGESGADPVAPTPAPPADKPTDTEGSVSAPITHSDDQVENADQAGTGDQSPTTDNDQVENASNQVDDTVVVPPVITPEMVSPVPEGVYETGDTAPEGHVFVAPSAQGDYQVVPTYFQGVSLARTGADALPYLIGLSAALASAGAILVRKRAAH